ncbi:MAG: hypothetical protein ACRDPS_10160 [Nocardioides sp.]|uniref:hypothetical protein n=1 Tax=Nocardioides sp. TaxID=35761 RepID=UPI003D6C5D53
MPVSANLDKLLMKDHEDKTLDELADAPIEAIAGISAARLEGLKAFGVTTVRDLGTNKFFKAAESIVALSDASKKGH